MFDALKRIHVKTTWKGFSLWKALIVVFIILCLNPNFNNYSQTSNILFGSVCFCEANDNFAQ